MHMLCCTSHTFKVVFINDFSTHCSAVPSIPTVIVHSITTSTIFISWSNKINADMYMVTWSSGLLENYMTLPGQRTSFEIRTNIEAGSSYMVMVTASNSVGSSESDALVLTTGK